MSRETVICWGIMAWMMFGSSCTRTKKETAIQSPKQSEDASESLSRDDRPVIVAFGDSLTAGAGVPPSQSYPSKLQQKIDQSGYEYKVVNAGISGETSSQGLDRLPDICALHPAIVLVEFGANDGLRGLPVADMARNLGAIIRGLQSAGAKVILAGMEIPPDCGLQYASSFRSAFKTLARELEVTLIPFFLEGVGGNPRLNQEDGIHPTAEGYDIIVETVWKALAPML